MVTSVMIRRKQVLAILCFASMLFPINKGHLSLASGQQQSVIIRLNERALTADEITQATVLSRNLPTIEIVTGEGEWISPDGLLRSIYGNDQQLRMQIDNIHYQDLAMVSPEQRKEIVGAKNQAISRFQLLQQKYAENPGDPEFSQQLPKITDELRDDIRKILLPFQVKAIEDYAQLVLIHSEGFTTSVLNGHLSAVLSNSDRDTVKANVDRAREFVQKETLRIEKEAIGILLDEVSEPSRREVMRFFDMLPSGRKIDLDELFTFPGCPGCPTPAHFLPEESGQNVNRKK